MGIKVRQAELQAAAYNVNDFPNDNLPEVAFIGRSNVGKSSLINRLLERKNLARTSSTPGKTRGLYFYMIDEKLYFVDLPGYGYAKVSKEERRTWGNLIESYLENRQPLCGCMHLVDCRHSPSEDDKLMNNWLRHNNVPIVTVATKTDKLSRGALNKQLSVIRKELELGESDPLFSFSSTTGVGRDLVWKAIHRLQQDKKG